MSGSYLLDTNIVIAFLSGEAAVKGRVEQADEILLSSVVMMLVTRDRHYDQIDGLKTESW